LCLWDLNFSLLLTSMSTPVQLGEKSFSLAVEKMEMKYG
jgi:hypothetical protein